MDGSTNCRFAAVLIASRDLRDGDHAGSSSTTKIFRSAFKYDASVLSQIVGSFVRKSFNSVSAVVSVEMFLARAD
jgi:hypothetical protein